MLWADDASPNLGIRALAAGSAALVRAAWPDAQVVHQNYGARSAPVRVGSLRDAARERVTGRGGLVPWLGSFDLIIDTRSGDSFSDIYGTNRLAVMTALADAVRRSGVPMVLGPQTIGPFRSRPGTWLARGSLRWADLVMARDHASAAEAARLGRPDVVRATDVVFALPRSEPTAHRDVLFNVSGLLWQEGPHVDAGEYRRTVLRCIRALVAAGRTVTLVPHVLDSPSRDNDVVILDDVVASLDAGAVEVVIPADLTDLRRIVAGGTITIGSRMHMCLNSLSSGTPAVPLAYSRKFAPLLADLGWQHSVDLTTDPDPARTLLGCLGAAEDNSGCDELLARAHGALAEVPGMLVDVTGARL